MNINFEVSRGRCLQGLYSQTCTNSAHLALGQGLHCLLIQISMQNIMCSKYIHQKPLTLEMIGMDKSAGQERIKGKKNSSRSKY